VKALYHAKDQYEGCKTRNDGTVSKVYADEYGNSLYEISYDDGDFAETVAAENVEVRKKAKDEKAKEEQQREEAQKLKKKKQKAKEQAR